MVGMEGMSFLCLTSSITISRKQLIGLVGNETQPNHPNNPQRMERRTMAKEMTLKDRAKNINSFLVSRKAGFEALAAKHMTPERIIKGFMSAATRTPNLLKCTQTSILNAVLTSVSLGLEIGRPRGGMYVIPFFNSKIKQYEAVAVPDYRGLMQLAYNSGKVDVIESRLVYANDHFEFSYGTETFVRHMPTKDTRGKLEWVYAVAHMKEGRPAFEVMNMADIEEHRQRSRAKDEGPWKTDFPAMARKTVIKVLCNLLPQSQDDVLARAIEYDTRQDMGEGVADLFDVIEVEGEEVKETGTDQAKDRLRGNLEKDSEYDELGNKKVDKTADNSATVAGDGGQPEQKNEAKTQPETEDAERKPEAKKSRGRPKKEKEAETKVDADATMGAEGDVTPANGGEPGEPPPLSADGPQEGDPDAPPPLHPMHDEFMNAGGGYTAAVNAFVKAWDDMGEGAPRLLAEAYELSGAQWAQFADSDDEIQALGMLKQHYWALAVIEGFPQG